MGSERTTVSFDRTVGELVAEDYARAAVFAEFGIDFCCGGDRSVARACAEAGVQPEAVGQALAALGRSDPQRPDPRGWSLGRLTDHIVTTHHANVRRMIPHLRQWTATISRVHGQRHPELHEVERLASDLADDLEKHMLDEESRLFPLISRLDEPAGGDAAQRARPGALIETLEDDHAHAGALARRLREVTDHYVTPSDACSTYTATFALLKEFEEDLHRHVHLENNILFPRARARWARGAAAVSSAPAHDRTGARSG